MCHHISNAVRRNLVSAHVPSHFKRNLLQFVLQTLSCQTSFQVEAELVVTVRVERISTISFWNLAFHKLTLLFLHFSNMAAASLQRVRTMASFWRDRPLRGSRKRELDLERLEHRHGTLFVHTAFRPLLALERI
jgi:hypothetical protein